MKKPRVEIAPPVRQPRNRWQQFWVMLLVAGLVLGGGGCGSRIAGNIWGKGSTVAVRPASGDSSRLLRNAHYFKLMGRMDLALKELEEAYQQEPQNPKVANALAQCYDELGEGERARQIYEKALAQESTNQVLNNNLCFSYYLVGKWQQAEACFRKILASNPNNVTARNNLGLVLIRQGRREEARSLWREAEGEGVAEGKVKQALAALGLEGSINKAAAPPPPQPPKPVATTPPAKGKATSPTTKVAVSPGPAPLKRPQLSQEELAETAIELRNGNGLKGIARKAGEILALDGFKVAVIGDHTDSEMQQTTIYYRPGEEKVARVLQEKFFRSAKLEEKPALTKVGVQVIMGHDVVKQQEFAAWAGATAQPVATPPPAQPKATSATTKAAVSPGPAPLKRPQLSKEELAETAIELRNGNGLKGIARKAGEILSLDGFEVAVIGDHTDSEMQQTTIYYRPGAERVARVLQDKFFRTAQLEKKPALTKVGVQVIMGHDVVKQQEFAAWAVAAAQPAATPSSAPPKATSPNTKVAVSPGPAPLKRPQLSQEELAETAIELRNGNGLKGIARKAREILSMDGFKVVDIGNHIDFGMQQTTIYYRPGAEKVARVLQDKFFRTAELEEKPALAKADVKIVMGHDLAKDQEVVALAGERGRP